MLIASCANLTLLRFELLQPCVGLVHAVTTRTYKGPDRSEALDLAWSPADDPAPLRRRLASIASALGADPRYVCCCARQVHGSRVQCIDQLPVEDPGAPCRAWGECDALITARPGIVLLIRVADCVPIVLYDPVRRVVGAVHAGWKGTLADVAGATVARMCSCYGCRACDLLAGIGPSIGPCCFEVGEDVCEQFRSVPGIASCVIRRGKGTAIDLPKANRLRLLGRGVLPHNVEMSGCCTVCRLDMFFSYRGEQGKTGRFGLFAGLRA